MNDSKVPPLLTAQFLSTETLEDGVEILFVLRSARPFKN